MLRIQPHRRKLLALHIKRKMRNSMSKDPLQHSIGFHGLTVPDAYNRLGTYLTGSYVLLENRHGNDIIVVLEHELLGVLHGVENDAHCCCVVD